MELAGGDFEKPERKKKGQPGTLDGQPKGRWAGSLLGRWNKVAGPLSRTLAHIRVPFGEQVTCNPGTVLSPVFALGPLPRPDLERCRVVAGRRATLA